MLDPHPSRHRISDLSRSEQSPEQVVERLLGQSSQRVEAQRPPSCTTPKSNGPTHLEVIDRVVANLPRRAIQLTRLALVAEMELLQLQRLPSGEIEAEIARCPHRYRNPILVDLLLDECRVRLFSAPAEAGELAEVAYIVASRLSDAELGRSWAMTVLARTEAYRGRALQANGELARAGSHLQNALDLFDREGNGDPFVEAELLELLAELRAAERRWVEAEGYLDMARGLYEHCQAEDKMDAVAHRKANLAGARDRLPSPALGGVEIWDRRGEAKGPQRSARLH